MRHNYYTICSRQTLYKCLALYETMKEYVADFKFFAVCKENDCIEVIKQLNPIDLVPIFLPEPIFTDDNMKVRAAAALRLFELREEIDHLLWLDCSLAILSDMQLLYEQWGNNSVLLLQQGSTNIPLENTVNIYSTAVMGCKRDAGGIGFLQNILSHPRTLKGVMSQELCKNAALLSLEDYTVNGPMLEELKIQKKDRSERNISSRFSWFDFDGLAYLDGSNFDIGSDSEKLGDSFIKEVYMPYIKKCKEAVHRINCVSPGFIEDDNSYDRTIKNLFNYNINLNNAERIYHFCTICDTECLDVLNNLYTSLIKRTVKFKLWVCCVNRNILVALKEKGLPNIEAFHLNNILEEHQILFAMKPIFRYYFMSFILRNNYAIKELLYLEPNYYFLINPHSIFREISENSIALFKENDVRQRLNKSYMTGLKRDIRTFELLQDLVNNRTHASEEELFHIIEHLYEVKPHNIGSLNLMDADIRYLRVFIARNTLIFNKRPVIAVRYAFDNKKSKRNKYIKLRPSKNSRHNNYFKLAGLPLFISRYRTI